MKRFDSMEWIAIILLIIGGLNWGLVGIFNYDVVSAIFGTASILSRLIFTLVGVAAIYELFQLFVGRDRSRNR